MNQICIHNIAWDIGVFDISLQLQLAKAETELRSVSVKNNITFFLTIYSRLSGLASVCVLVCVIITIF